MIPPTLKNAKKKSTIELDKIYNESCLARLKKIADYVIDLVKIC